MDEPLWQPPTARIEASNMRRFMRQCGDDWGVTFERYKDLYAFSVASRAQFWSSLRRFADLRADTWGERVVADGDAMPGARWFPDARLNFAANLLRRRDDARAIMFFGEDGRRRDIAWGELYAEVARLAEALGDAGVAAGDRVAGVVANVPEAIVAMLATTAIGAVWSSCSPDFGVQGIVDRFGQIAPKVLFSTDGYVYAGKRFDALGRLSDLLDRLPSVERLVVLPLLAARPALPRLPRVVAYGDFVAGAAAGDIAFRMLPFDHPVYILYSSGTTGVPKCIVHGAGGTLLQHVKEHQLHCDVKAGDRVFYFTTCGWMMWNWLASALASEATVVLYDGAPTHSAPSVLFDIADEAAITLFGTSAKFIQAIEKAGVRPAASHRLQALRTITSTGSPLPPESFDYVYRDVKADVHLASISGGTDIVSCFVLGNPVKPVWRGEIQGPGLGMAVDVFDDEGRPLRAHKGELVCTEPFPSMPIGFWNDPEGGKYHNAYFNRFPGVWHHGDFAETTAHGGLIIHGRSDATLNPGGVRIGTAEIYRQVESFDEILEAVAIGQDWDGDTRVVLFVVLRPGAVLDDDLAGRIRARIRVGCSPRHVPARIVAVADIPRTKSGKITELAVRDVVHGREIKNREALVNPEALELFRDLAELRG